MKLNCATFSDKDGFVERECPNEKCGYIFKVKGKDWSSKIFGGEAYCPMCKIGNPADSFWTHDQARLLMSFFEEQNEPPIKEALTVAEETDTINFGLSGYKCFSKGLPANLPIVNENWYTEITCDACSTKYKVILGAFACPCCAVNNVRQAYFKVSEKRRDILRSVKDLKGSPMFENDSDFERSMLVYCLKDNVSSFSALCSDLYRGIGIFKEKAGTFSDIVRGNRAFRSSYGIGYNDFISNESILKLKKAFLLSSALKYNSRAKIRKKTEELGNLDNNETHEILLITDNLAKGLVSYFERSKK